MKIVSLISSGVLCVFATLSRADLIIPIDPTIPIDPIEPRFRLVEVFPTGKANFAMVMKNGSTGEEILQMARLTSLNPAQAVFVNYEMDRYDGSYNRLQKLHASPGNQLLAAYNLLDNGIDIIDHNLVVYRMQDGTLVDGSFTNEEQFSGLNETNTESDILNGCIESLREGGEPEENLGQLRFVLEVDSTRPPIIRWHSDRELSFTIEPYVLVYFNGEPVPRNSFDAACSGQERFTRYKRFSDAGVVDEWFAPIRAEAAYPYQHNLAPADNTLGYVTLNGNRINFLTTLYLGGRLYNLYLPHQRKQVEGTVPRIFYFERI